MYYIFIFIKIQTVMLIIHNQLMHTNTESTALCRQAAYLDTKH